MLLENVWVLEETRLQAQPGLEARLVRMLHLSLGAFSHPERDQAQCLCLPHFMSNRQIYLFISSGIVSHQHLLSIYHNCFSTS